MNNIMDRLKHYIDLYIKKEHYDTQIIYDKVVIPYIDEIAQNIGNIIDDNLSIVEFIEELFCETFYYVVIDVLKNNKQLINKNDTWYYNIILIETQKYKYYSKCYELIFTVGRNTIIDNILSILHKKKHNCRNRIKIIYAKCVEYFSDYFDTMPEIKNIVETL